MSKITHHHLSAEQINDDQGPAIMLTQQDDYSEPSTVLVHPWQLRAVCEQFGIIANDPQAEKTIATLMRRLQLLNQRIQHLDHWLRTYSDTKHADLTYELGFSGGIADMAEEFCAELLDAAPATSAPPAPDKPESNTVQALRATPPQASLI